MNKKLFSAAVGAGLVLAAVVPAFAADCSNVITGPHSTNTCNVKTKKSASLYLFNSATVGNHATVNSNTGGNENEWNTSSGSTLTGPADGSVKQKTTANTTIVGVDQSAGHHGVGDGMNNITGPGSHNSVKLSNTKSADVTVENYASVHNSANVTTNSGNNEQEHNTIAGDIVTGPVMGSVHQSNTLNSTVVTIVQ